MTPDQLRTLRERLHLQEEVPEGSLADDKEPPYITLPPDSAAYEYMMQRRQALDGSLPSRLDRTKRPLELPADAAFAGLRPGSGKQAASTTTAFTRPLRNLRRDPTFRPRVDPLSPHRDRPYGIGRSAWRGLAER